MTDMLVGTGGAVSKKIPLPVARPEEANSWRIYQEVKDTTDVISDGGTSWLDELYSQFSYAPYTNTVFEKVSDYSLLFKLGGVVVASVAFWYGMKWMYQLLGWKW